MGINNYQVLNRSLVLICLVLMLTGDMLACLAFNLDFKFWNFGALIKSPLEVLFLIEMYRHKKLNIYLFIPLLLLIIWSVGITTTFFSTGGHIKYSQAGHMVDDETTNSAFSASFVVFNRYILFFLVYPVLLYYKNDNYFINGCKKIFEGFFYINSIAILLGYLLKLDVFASYNFKESVELGYDIRFGYKGMIYGINEITGVYFLGLAYGFREIFINKNNKKIPLLFLIVIASLLTGAKGCALAILMLTVYYIAAYKTRIFVFAMFPVLIAGVVYIINVDVVAILTDTLNVSVSGDDSNWFLSLPITFLTSARNIYLYYNGVYMLNNWGILNYIFGDGLLYSEADLADLYYFFGLGTIAYLYFYGRFFFLKDKSNANKYVFAFMLFLGFISGHVIRSAIVPTFLSLYLITQTTIVKKETTNNSEALALN